MALVHTREIFEAEPVRTPEERQQAAASFILGVLSVREGEYDPDSGPQIRAQRIVDEAQADYRFARDLLNAMGELHADVEAYARYLEKPQQEPGQDRPIFIAEKLGLPPADFFDLQEQILILSTGQAPTLKV